MPALFSSRQLTFLAPSLCLGLNLALPRIIPAPLVCSMVGTRSGSKRASPGASSSKAAPAAPAKKAAKRARAVPAAKHAGKAEPRVDGSAQRFWLLKSEPESRLEKNAGGKTIDMKFGIEDLILCKDQTEPWDGVRNHEAKNAMMEMKVGELGFFYHSNCKKTHPHIAGIVKIVREAYPDHTAWDSADPHFDKRSSQDAPRWFMVDVQFVRKFKKPVSLDDVKAKASLADMRLVKRSRISVMEIREEEWKTVVGMADDEVEE